MTKAIRLISVGLFLSYCLPLPGSLARAQGTPEPFSQTFNVDGQKRTALIYIGAAPAPKAGAPLVFIFHGHGGAAYAVARKLRLHASWPEAVVAYMQGIPGVQGVDDPEGKKTGWQKRPGDLDDRDVKFADIALAQIVPQFNIDPNRIYALGHSNGGRFVNVLWNMRGDKFAAFCSASGPGGQLLTNAVPRSVFIIAGERDPIVPFENQKQSIELVRKVLRTDPSKAVVTGYCRSEPGINGTELVTYVHPNGHEFPPEAIPLVVQFFQRHKKG